MLSSRYSKNGTLINQHTQENTQRHLVCIQFLTLHFSLSESKNYVPVDYWNRLNRLSLPLRFQEKRLLVKMMLKMTTIIINMIMIIVIEPLLVVVFIFYSAKSTTAEFELSSICHDKWTRRMNSFLTYIRSFQKFIQETRRLA